MKYFFSMFFLMFLFPAFVVAQSNSKQAKIEAEIRQVMEDLHKAYLTGDKALFDRIVADEWMITLGSGTVEENAKAEEMSSIMALDPSYILRNDEVKVRVYGNTAIVSRLNTDKGKFDGQDIDRISRITDVLVKRKERWQVVSTHITRIRKPQQLSECQFSRSEFQKLRWLEGTWRGSDGGQNVFYERYHFVDDTTIEIEYFGNDETLSKIKRKGNVSLLNGAILHRDESGGWSATAIDDKSVHFAPKQNADNSFSWEKQTSDLWLARLKLSDPQGKNNDKVYRMERHKP